MHKISLSRLTCALQLARSCIVWTDACSHRKWSERITRARSSSSSSSIRTSDSAHFREHFVALNERSSTLHEIVDNHDVSSLGLALLDAHNSFLIVPDFGTDDLRAPRVAEHLMEAFPCTFVRIRDGDEFRVRELSKSRLEQRHAGQEERQHRVSKVESLLQRVNVEDDQRGWTAARERHIREHSREARGREPAAAARGGRL